MGPLQTFYSLTNDRALRLLLSEQTCPQIMDKVEQNVCYSLLEFHRGFVLCRYVMNMSKVRIEPGDFLVDFNTEQMC